MNYLAQGSSSRATLFAVLLLGWTAFGQIFTTSGGVSPGSISVTSQYNANTAIVLNGQHDGIQCTLNQDCAVQVTTTFAPGYFLESQSQIFLTSWDIATSTSGGDAIGRVKVRLIQNSYNPTTGSYSWTAALRVNGQTNNTYGVSYSFSIYRGYEATNNWITKNLSKSCSGVGGCSVAATQNTLNVAPAGTTFRGFMMTGFDVRATLGTSRTLQHIAVDGSINAAGTAEGGYSAAENRKQGMSCAFLDSSSQTASCTVYTAAFSSVGGNFGYVTNSNQFLHSINYDASSPNYDYFTSQSYSEPSIKGSTFAGLFTPLKSFDLQYTDIPAGPPTRELGAGCFNVQLDNGNPNTGSAYLFVLIT